MNYLFNSASGKDSRGLGVEDPQGLLQPFNLQGNGETNVLINIITFPMIAILYGVAVLIGGLGKVQITMDMLRAKNSKWWWGAISAAISIICAFVMLNNPFSSTVALWWFTGISLIVEAVFDMITLIMRRKNDGGTEA